MAAEGRPFKGVLYAGLMSVAVAYTLQVVGQSRAHPAHAAVILSLESVFAAVGGWVLLGEVMGARALAGCGLMLAGVLIAQINPGSPVPAANVAEKPQNVI